MGQNVHIGDDLPSPIHVPRAGSALTMSPPMRQFERRCVCPPSFSSYYSSVPRPLRRENVPKTAERSQSSTPLAATSASRSRSFSPEFRRTSQTFRFRAICPSPYTTEKNLDSVFRETGPSFLIETSNAFPAHVKNGSPFSQWASPSPSNTQSLKKTCEQKTAQAHKSQTSGLRSRRAPPHLGRHRVPSKRKARELRGGTRSGKSERPPEALPGRREWDSEWDSVRVTPGGSGSSTPLLPLPRWTFFSPPWQWGSLASRAPRRRPANPTVRSGRESTWPESMVVSNRCDDASSHPLVASALTEVS